MKYDGQMDKEVIPLCNAMNSINKKIFTIESCSGHGKEPLRIWFKCHDLRVLPKLLYWFDGCHSGEYGWVASVHTDCGMSPVTFMVESPQKGKEAYKSADHISRCIKARTYVK